MGLLSEWIFSIIFPIAIVIQIRNNEFIDEAQERWLFLEQPTLLYWDSKTKRTVVIDMIIVTVDHTASFTNARQLLRIISRND